MCLSKLGQIVYGVLAMATVLLIGIAMFTPGWSRLSAEISGGNKTGIPDLNKITQVNLGLFMCQIPTTETTIAPTDNPAPNKLQSSDTTTIKKTLETTLKESLDTCSNWFLTRSIEDQIVIAAMVLALLTAIVAFLWNLCSFFACCCKGGITRPLPALAGLTATLLTVALIVYYLNNQKDIEKLNVTIDKTDLDGIQNTTKEFLKELGKTNKVSYSFYLGCVAAVIAFTNMIVGTIIVCLADKCI